MIRDFIYLDGDRLYSLYAQAFEGVAEKIVESFVSQLTSTDSQKSGPLSGARLDTSSSERSQRTENKLLHDYMYDQLETKLSPAILRTSGLDTDRLLDHASRFPLVHVTGDAEIEDSERMREFFDRFNELGMAIFQAGAGSEVDPVIPNFGAIKDRNARKKAQAEFRSSRDPKLLAKAAGLQQEERVLASLKLVTELFNRKGLEVLFSTTNLGGLAFKAVLDQRWLRVQPDLLRRMHAGLPASGWTLVGHVTHFPARKWAQPSQKGEGDSSLRDSYRQMFRAARDIEHLFFEGKQVEEIVVAPIAIYRELDLSTPADGN